MTFNAEQFMEAKTLELKNQVGDGSAICATSGGVDSMACAALGNRVLGKRLVAVFIDDGLMREGEPEQVTNDLKKLGIENRRVDVKDEFFSALKGLEDPEEKRKAFRDTFYKVLGRTVKESGANFLIQGTIAADVVETKGGVKTQHNVLEQIGIDPRSYGLVILEPLKEIYKPEVREVARGLGLPESVYARMPFPGPGLATRVLGEVTPERVETVRKATKIVEDEVKNLRPFQAFAVLLKDMATGVEEGKRKFGEIVVVRSVESSNAITAEITKIPWVILTAIQERITREIPSVTKVLYDITPKPPSTIEYI
jgi:GMP synthase (glutamine-hydrolysing)